MIEVIEATEKEIPVIIAISQKTWPVAYASILSPEQMHFMLDTIYSAKELVEVMRNDSQRFLLLKDNNEFQGFASFGPRKEEPDIFKLHKIYILPHNQGKGYGKMLIDEVKRHLLNQGIKTLDLNVNRHNPAKGFYEKLGFKIIREEDIPIGEYWMNDYVMRLTF